MMFFRGINLYGYESSNNIISGNHIADSRYVGCYLDYGTSNNTIIGNNLTNNENGIGLGLSTFNNSVMKNNIAGGLGGISIYYSSNNSIVENTIAATTYVGIGLSDSSNSIIYHNNFLNNAMQIIENGNTPPVNVWDNGYSSGGNYWSDYNGTDNNQDGIGDTPYTIDANNTDHYPLMGTFQSFNVSLLNKFPIQFEEVDIISNSTIGKVDLIFADDANNPPTYMDWYLHLSEFAGQNGTVGFCRITFPNDMLYSSSYPITTISYMGVNENLTISKVLSSNGTHTTLYFTYQLLTPHFGLIILPEFPSFLILPLFFITTLLAAIIYRKKHAKISRSPQSGCDFVDTEKEKG
jgi:parallel beta-helix repeat protein